MPARLVAAFLAVVLATGCGDSGGSRTATATGTQGQPFEATLDRPVTELNPFDPAQIQVDGEFRSPSDQVLTIPGFVSRSYDRSLVGGFEKLAATSELQWKIRFTPTEPGTWEWRWVVRTPEGEEFGDWSDIEVNSAADYHGWLRVSERDPRYLEFADSTSFFAVGENMCWYDGRGTFAYDEWIARLAEQGGNYIRLWMPSWAFGLEVIQRGNDGSVASSSLGNYQSRLDRAWQLDYIIELARRHGIQVMLSIQSHGEFRSLTTRFGSTALTTPPTAGRSTTARRSPTMSSQLFKPVALHRRTLGLRHQRHDLGAGTRSISSSNRRRKRWRIGTAKWRLSCAPSIHTIA
jgi:hypothetical protein